MQNAILLHKDSVSLQYVDISLHSVMVLRNILRTANVIDLPASVHRDKMFHKFFDRRIIIHTCMVHPRNLLKKRDCRYIRRLDHVDNLLGILALGNIRNLYNDTVEFTEIRERKDIVFALIIFFILTKITE